MDRMHDTDTIRDLESLAMSARAVIGRAALTPADIDLIERVARDAEQVADALRFHAGEPSKTNWTGFAVDDVRSQVDYVREELTAAVEDVRSRYGIAAPSNAAADHFAWLDGQRMASRVRGTMEAAEFAAYHTGGGCLAWHLDKGDGSYVLVCTEGNDLDGDPSAAEWLVGRHDPEGGFVELAEPMTLDEALAAAGRLPSPAEVGGIGSQHMFATAEEADNILITPRAPA